VVDKKRICNWKKLGKRHLVSLTNFYIIVPIEKRAISKSEKSSSLALTPPTAATDFRGCQMVCFQTKNPNLGKFWRVLLRKLLEYCMTIWSILRSLKIFYGHLVYFVAIWYIFSPFWFCGPRKIWQPC
jgi:hypothetical protein